MTGRPPNIPTRGDVPAGMIARLMGLALPDFQAVLPALATRGFPTPDPTTGLYCVEAVDRWRLRRHAALFPQLTAASGGVHAAAVFDQRRREVFGRG